MTNNLLEAFDQAYQNLQLQPLVTQEELDKFRVPYAHTILAELKELVRSSTPGNDKIIFSGHLGCGKTTLLAEFSTRQEQQYFVVFFSISDMIEMSDIDHIKILFAIAVQMMDKAEQQKIDIPKSIKDKFYNWFATRSKINIEEYRAELGAGFDLLKIIKGKLKTDAVTRSEIKLELERHFSELIERINEIATTVETATGKKILVIIDDLDKLDLALVEKIYRDNVKALFAPQFRIIFTIPIAVIRNIGLREMIRTETTKIKIMPVSKLFTKGSNRQPDTIPLERENLLLLDILQKRMPSELIEAEIAQQIAIKSGGVLRELVRIANKCCEECQLLLQENPLRQDVKINQNILQKALTEIRLEFTVGLGKAKYEILTATYNNFEPEDQEDQNFLDLLHGLYVLEYKNDDLWYDVHPIVGDLLKRRGLIS
jgi:hypothetical protein